MKITINGEEHDLPPEFGALSYEDIAQMAGYPGSREVIVKFHSGARVGELLPDQTIKLDDGASFRVAIQAARDGQSQEREMSEHTPGPWAFDGDWHRIPTIFGAYGETVASVEKGHANSIGNAKLIAAAPKMLTALELIASLTSGPVHDIARIAAQSAKK